MAKCRVFLSFKKWDKYQKRITSRWVKWWHCVREDPEFLKLTATDRWHFCALLLLAGKTNNYFAYEPLYLQRQMDCNCAPICDLLPLIKGQFFDIHRSLGRKPMESLNTESTPHVHANALRGEERREEEILFSEEKNREKSIVKPDVPGLTPRLLLELWNEKRKTLPKVLTLTEKRSRHAKQRLHERPNLTFWADVFDLIQTFPFLYGENPRQWRCSFDWIIANDENYVKVLEGRYGKM